jgi:hypothetical protein
MLQRRISALSKFRSAEAQVRFGTLAWMVGSSAKSVLGWRFAPACCAAQSVSWAPRETAALRPSSSDRKEDVRRAAGALGPSWIEVGKVKTGKAPKAPCKKLKPLQHRLRAASASSLGALRDRQS